MKQVTFYKGKRFSIIKYESIKKLNSITRRKCYAVPEGDGCFGRFIRTVLVFG